MRVLDDHANLERLRTLKSMLAYRRPMGSKTEGKFKAEYLHTLPEATTDQFGNVHVHVPRRDAGFSTVLWSSHTDTVHRDEHYQSIAVTSRYFQLAEHSKSNCLGADDTVGVWIMREMILARVPGHYVFHHGEERGGIGSSSIAWDTPEVLARVLFAIAFDRRGKRDVITHQAGDRCCSNAFARSLARQLRPVARYRPNAGGIYTDTAEYIDYVPECTNVSVGYESEHTPYERVDYWHALNLLNTLLTIDETKLACERVPGTRDTKRYNAEIPRIVSDVITLPSRTHVNGHSDIHWRDYDWRLADDSDVWNDTRDLEQLQKQVRAAYEREQDEYARYRRRWFEYRDTPPLRWKAKR